MGMLNKLERQKRSERELEWLSHEKGRERESKSCLCFTKMLVFSSTVYPSGVLLLFEVTSILYKHTTFSSQRAALLHSPHSSHKLLFICRLEKET